MKYLTEAYRESMTEHFGKSGECIIISISYTKLQTNAELRSYFWATARAQAARAAKQSGWLCGAASERSELES